MLPNSSDTGCGGLSTSMCPCFVDISIRLWTSANDNKGGRKPVFGCVLRVRKVGQRNQTQSAAGKRIIDHRSPIGR